MNQQGVARKYSMLVLLMSIVALASWTDAQAGPITNGPGVAPFVKLGVYQGVISVVPGGLTDSILEIGNAGRDIASTGSIYLRPGTIGGQGGNVILAAQSTPNEGGELALAGAGSYQTWNLDAWQNRFRVHTNGEERLIIDGTTGGNVYLPTGSLCFGNVGSTNCISGPGGPSTTPTLDAVLGAGNASVRSAALGAAVVPASKLVVNNGTTSTGNANDAISLYANTLGSAVYAQQDNSAGYAGYFSGRVRTTIGYMYPDNTIQTTGKLGVKIPGYSCPSLPTGFRAKYNNFGTCTVGTDYDGFPWAQIHVGTNDWYVFNDAASINRFCVDIGYSGGIAQGTFTTAASARWQTSRWVALNNGPTESSVNGINCY